MATKLRPHGWTHVLHDYGWQVCGSTYNLTPISTPTKLGCYHLDQYGRLLPDPQRYPSTAAGGSWKPFVDKVHGQGIAFGLHLIHGVPIIAAQKKLSIMGTNFTLDELVAESHCPTFIADHWMMNTSHPGAQAYYDSVVTMWAEQGIDFIYLDGVVGEPCGCHLDAVALVADSLRRLGNGMFMYTSYGPPSEAAGCSYEALSELAPYVRVGGDTEDNWFGGVELGFSVYTRDKKIQPHHFGDMASLMVGKVHCRLGTPHKPECGPGPDYFIPSNESSLTKDEVISYASLVAMFRSTWWPSGVLSEMDDFQHSLMTNDAVIRVTMMSTWTRQVPTSASTPANWGGPGVVWAADDTEEEWKYVMLTNMCPCSTEIGCLPGCDPHGNSNVDVDFLQLGLPQMTSCEVTDLWSNVSMGRVTGKLRASLRPHASMLARLSDCVKDETRHVWMI